MSNSETVEETQEHVIQSVTVWLMKFIKTWSSRLNNINGDACLSKKQLSQISDHMFINDGNTWKYTVKRDTAQLKYSSEHLFIYLFIRAFR